MGEELGYRDEDMGSEVLAMDLPKVLQKLAGKSSFPSR